MKSEHINLLDHCNYKKILLLERTKHHGKTPSLGELRWSRPPWDKESASKLDTEAPLASDLT